MKLAPSVIGDRLAKITLWAGATALPYTLAQRSTLVAETANAMHGPLCALHALFFEAHAILTGDTTPITAYLSAESRAKIADAKRGFDQQLASALGLDWPCPYAVTIRSAAERVMLAEARDLLRESQTFEAMMRAAHNAPMARPIKPWAWPVAADAFASAFRNLEAMARIGADVD